MRRIRKWHRLAVEGQPHLREIIVRKTSIGAEQNRRERNILLRIIEHLQQGQRVAHFDRVKISRGQIRVQGDALKSESPRKIIALFFIERSKMAISRYASFRTVPFLSFTPGP